jgi:hypothetical protein
MNCEDFLPALETGDAAQQREARQHAAVCPRCAAAQASLVRLKSVLAAHEPLPAAARAVWEQAARAPAPEPLRRPNWLPRLAGLLTASAACAVVFILVIPRDAGRGRIAGISGSTTVIEHDSTAELAHLKAAVDSLDGNLVALAEHAERLETEREIALTLNQYTRW